MKARQVYLLLLTPIAMHSLWTAQNPTEQQPQQSSSNSPSGSVTLFLSFQPLQTFFPRPLVYRQPTPRPNLPNPMPARPRPITQVEIQKVIDCHKDK
ncbi:hypothetical protein CCHR01_03232 [Colletotrichum chrysophilum]|uniref:Uncharacterized protein n=2 Tax=Colletotrichum gloeosporioides species complex TaxID=2707338 RepID=A0A8H3WBY3_9PEZI|nr:hypothetical protein GQ607_006564 [Colletotrichum asianum]KAH9241403.1 hypothetical protein K456DRAFT_617283 [Colletotrichum gloeosporioides 23]KAK1854149.1 hypothetical protein CCHR01_03232 [Colletotrichum chrysophilum]